MNKLVLALLSSAALSASCAAYGADPLAVSFIKVSNYSQAATAHVVLDGNEACDTKDKQDCVFSSDCSQPIQDICVDSDVRLGTHKVEAFVGGQHLTAWVDVKNVAPGVLKGGMGECSIEDDEGTLKLDCL